MCLFCHVLLHKCFSHFLIFALIFKKTYSHVQCCYHSSSILDFKISKSGLRCALFTRSVVTILLFLFLILIFSGFFLFSNMMPYCTFIALVSSCLTRCCCRQKRRLVYKTHHIQIFLHKLQHFPITDMIYLSGLGCFKTIPSKMYQQKYVIIRTTCI